MDVKIKYKIKHSFTNAC